MSIEELSEKARKHWEETHRLKKLWVLIAAVGKKLLQSELTYNF